MEFGMDARRPQPTSHTMLPDYLARRPLLPLVLITAMVVGFSVVAMLTTGEGFLTVLRRLGPVILVGVGTSMMVAGARRRIGRAEHCVACGYEKRTGGGSSPVCPECGAAWNRLGGTARGRLKQNRILFWCGLAVAIAYLAGPFSALIVGQSVHLRLAPTAVLIDRIGHDGFTGAAWDELRHRGLSTEQQSRLAQNLLDKRRRGHTLGHDQRKWLETMVRTGTLPTELVQRHQEQ
jgi:hypothetical protein